VPAPPPPHVSFYYSDFKEVWSTDVLEAHDTLPIFQAVAFSERMAQYVFKFVKFCICLIVWMGKLKLKCVYKIIQVAG
jgi:hypothetical protein